MTNDEVRVHLAITGRVQGVSYRWSMREEAQRLGLAGWVRNLADGSVEAEAQGSAQAVGDLVTWAHHGPGAAEVASVEVSDLTPVAGATGFEVR